MTKLFEGCKIYCTGTFQSHDKKELTAIIEGLGGEYAKGFSELPTTLKG